MKTDKSYTFQMLEKDFSSTFLTELMPGILHNFANPLNGIMGRSKLLQRRFDETVRKIMECHPAAAMEFKENFNKISNDIHAIGSESDNFFGMFKDAANKFYGIDAHGLQAVQLSKLIQAEMRFFNFYLDFKHEVQKHLELQEELPDVTGNYAEFSMGIWGLIRHCMSAMKNRPQKELGIAVQSDDRYVRIRICDSGEPLSDEQARRLASALESGAGSEELDEAITGLFYSLMVFKTCGAIFKIEPTADGNRYEAAIPCRDENA
jgi:signal transduction histidine kinase